MFFKVFFKIFTSLVSRLHNWRTIGPLIIILLPEDSNLFQCTSTTTPFLVPVKKNRNIIKNFFGEIVNTVQTQQAHTSVFIRLKILTI